METIDLPSRAPRDGDTRRVRVGARAAEHAASIDVYAEELAEREEEELAEAYPSETEVRADAATGPVWLLVTMALTAFSAYLLRWRLAGLGTPELTFAVGFAVVLVVAGLLLLGPLQELRGKPTTDTGAATPRWLTRSIWIVLLLTMLLFALLGVLALVYDVTGLNPQQEAERAATWDRWSRNVIAGAVALLLIATELVLAIAAGRTYVWFRWIRTYQRHYTRKQELRGEVTRLKARIKSENAILVALAGGTTGADTRSNGGPTEARKESADAR